MSTPLPHDLAALVDKIKASVKLLPECDVREIREDIQPILLQSITELEKRLRELLAVR